MLVFSPPQQGRQAPALAGGPLRSMLTSRVRAPGCGPAARPWLFRRTVQPGAAGSPARRVQRRGALLVAAAQRPRRPESADAVAARAGEYPSVFFEPFVRCFVLGASAGVAFELLHSASKLLDLASRVGLGDLAAALPQARDSFAPVVLPDHLVAVGCWLLLYAIEAYAVMKVLEQHAQNPEELDRRLRSLVTLPRLMLPRFRVFGGLLRVLGFVGGPPPLAPVLQAAPAGAPADVAPPSGRGSSGGGGGGGGVRPQGNVVPMPRTKPARLPPLAPPQRDPEAPLEEERVEDVTAAPAPAPGPAAGAGLGERRKQAGLAPGQLDPAAADALHRAKELRSRRMYLRNFWYAAALSEAVGSKPVGVEILGERVVLFRDSAGKVQCLSDVCPHRGAPLHMGWTARVEGRDCVVCPYHGWAFDGEGRLRDVPAAESRAEWPRKPLVASYPVQEKGGFVWLFYGSAALPAEERPPIPWVPELADPAWRPVYGEIEFECPHWSVFENAIDMAHIHYLHSDSFGNDQQPQIRDMTCATHAYGIEAAFALHNKPVNALWEFAKVPEVRVRAQALLPSTSVIGFTLGNGLSFITFVSTVPISATRSVNRFALIRRLEVDAIGAAVFNMRAWDRFARAAMLRILGQDKAMVERLVPEMLGREISVKADLPQTAFRKLRQSYIDLGYGVAPGSSLAADTSDAQQPPGRDM